MPLERITSRHNPRIQALYKLKTAQGRAEAQRFLIEGLREVAIALAAEVPLQTLWVCTDLMDKSGLEFFQNFQKQLEQKGRSVEVMGVSKEVFLKCCYREKPDGFLASASIEKKPLEGLQDALKDVKNPLILILEGLEKPGNMGAILRSAEALGAHALIFTETVCDLHNPNLIRSSQGLLFVLPIAVASNEATLAFLKKHAITPFSTHAQADKAPWEADLKSACAIVLGNEHTGVSPFWQKNAQPLRIPQSGQADSLNVSTAGGIIIYEALRQRSGNVRAG